MKEEKKEKQFGKLKSNQRRKKGKRKIIKERKKKRTVDF